LNPLSAGAVISEQFIFFGAALIDEPTPIVQCQRRVDVQHRFVLAQAHFVPDLAFPDQFEISAVLRLFSSPRGRNSLIVADVILCFDLN
jgi:hypothetical protein